MQNEAKIFCLVSQKQAKMKRNKMCFASFCFEAKIKKERKRDTLDRRHMFCTGFRQCEPMVWFENLQPIFADRFIKISQKESKKGRQKEKKMHKNKRHSVMQS
jgi:hypothetical protein